MRSSSKDQAAGTLDRIGGRVLETFGKLTGRRTSSAKGKAARGRGRARKGKAGTKRRFGR